MQKSGRLLSVSALAFLVSVFLFISCSKTNNSGDRSTASDSSEIKVGLVGSLTGGEASFGISTKEGVDLAVEEINKTGGINGKKIRILSTDDQGKPEEAATAATKLITQDRVVAILGEVASSRSLAMAPIAQANKVPMVTPTSTNPRVTQVGDFIFRVCFIDPFQGSVMANFAAKSLKIKRAAILRDIKSDYSMGLAAFFIETFKKQGGEIVADQSYSSGDVDFKTQLTSLKAKNPDTIFVPGYYTEVGLIARQAKEMGLKVPLLGGDGWDSSKLLEIGGSALNGSYFSNHYAADDTSPKIRKFVADYQARYKNVPDSMAVLGYDAMLVLADAMKRSKSLDGPELKAALASTRNFPGVTGKISINENRDAIKPAVVLLIDKGKYNFKESVAPSS